MSAQAVIKGMVRRDEFRSGWWFGGRFVADTALAESIWSATFHLILRDLEKESE